MKRFLTTEGKASASEKRTKTKKTAQASLGSFFSPSGTKSKKPSPSSSAKADGESTTPNDSLVDEGKPKTHRRSKLYAGLKLPGGFTAHDDSLLVWETPSNDSDNASSSGSSTGERSLPPSSRIAGFDFDGCLAKTSMFKRGPDAWRVMHENVVPTLRQCHEEGFKVSY